MNRKGFTLVEIMIVVAIIGILTAIAVPGFIKARDRSRTTSCQENQTKIDSAIQQFILEEDLANMTAFIDDYPDWDAARGVLVGEDFYLRFDPLCPLGGQYQLNDEPNTPTVNCEYNDPNVDPYHPYPGFEEDPDAE